MTDAKETDDRKRAAALAEKVETLGVLIAFQMKVFSGRKADEDLIVRALRAYADQPAAPGGLVEVVTAGIADVQIPGGMRHDEYCGADGLRMVAAAALSAISAAGYVIRPREPTEAMIEAALDAWFTDPQWREAFAGHPCRDFMRRALCAALATGAGHEA